MRPSPTNTRKLALAAILACAVLFAPDVGASAATHGKPGRLGVDSVRVGSRTGPLTIRVRAGAHAQLAIWAQGRRVHHPFEFAGRRTQSIALRAADGLRPGADRIRIRARHGGRTYEARRTVRVPGWALLADAGADNDSMVGAPAQLGTGAAVGGRTGLAYHWRIVKRPRRGGATLVGRNQAQPMLRAKAPGTYVLQLRVDPGGNRPDSFDQVTVPVAPNDPPIGAALNTIAANYSISIGSDNFGGGQLCACTSYVILQRSTRYVEESGRVVNNAKGIADLTAIADKYGDEAHYLKDMMILSGPLGVPHAQIDDFARLLKKIGVALPSAENFAALDNPFPLPYSVIGIPGAAAGAGTTRIPGGYQPPVSGAMVGYLQKNQAVASDGTALYDYVAPEHPTYDTRAESTATTNKMVVNGVPFGAGLPAGATAGFHVVVLESMALRPLANVALATNNGSSDRALQKSAAEELVKLTERPGGPLVLVQTIGKPKAAGPEWAGIVKQLVRLGANPQLVNALNGTTEYAFVSRNGAEEPPAEASTAFDVGYPDPHYPAARLVGALARSRTSNFVPNVSSVPTPANPKGTVNLALMEIAYQNAQDWPALAPAAGPGEAAAAQKFICTALNFCQSADSCSQLRECFWQKYGSEWGDKRITLLGLSYEAGKGFNEATFAAVKTELLKEIGQVVSVKAYIKQLQEPLDQSSLRSYVDLQEIGDKVWNALQPDPVNNSTSWILGLIGKTISIGSFAGPPASAGAAGLAAVFGLASYLSNKQGQPILGAEVKAKSRALAGEMLDRLQLARKTTTGLGMLFVSDFGKLEAASKHIDADWSLPESEVLSNNLRTAARQWYWEALLPTAFPYLLRGNGVNARSLDCRMDGRAGWPNQPDAFQMTATVGYNPDGSPIKAIFFFTRGIGGGSSPDARKLDDEIFRPRDGPRPGLGIEKLSLFTARVWGGRILHAVSGTRGCSVEWLPNLF